MASKNKVAHAPATAEANSAAAGSLVAVSNAGPDVAYVSGQYPQVAIYPWLGTKILPGGSATVLVGAAGTFWTSAPFGPATLTVG